MKKVILSVVLTFILIFNIPNAAQSDLSMNELEELTKNLLANLTPEEQEAVIKQAEEMDRYINSLPENERRAIENALEDELKSFIQSGELDNLTKPAPAALPVSLQEQPKKEEKKLTLTQQHSSLQAELKELSSHIGDLILKSQASTRVSIHNQIESMWPALKTDLTQLQSYVLVAANNNIVTDALLSDEFKLLKEQLLTFNKNLNSELEKVKMEPLSSGSLSKVANLDNVIKLVDKEVNNNQLLWNTKRLIQKHAPQEIKEDPKKNQPKTTSASLHSNSSTIPLYKPASRYPSTPTSPNALASSPKFNPVSNSSSGSYGSYPSAEDRPQTRSALDDLNKGSRSSAESPNSASQGSSDATKKDKSSLKSKANPTLNNNASSDSNLNSNASRSLSGYTYIDDQLNEYKEAFKKFKKEMVACDLFTKLQDYKSGISSSDSSSISSSLNISKDLSKAFSELDSLTVIPTRIIHNIDSFISKFTPQQQDEIKKVAYKNLKSILKKRVSKLKEGLDEIIKLDVKDISSSLKSKHKELCDFAQTLKGHINDLESSVKLQ